MSQHSEKLLEVEMELRELRPLRAMREEMEALRGAVESMRSVVASLDSVRPGPGTHTLSECDFCIPASWLMYMLIEDPN